MGLKEAIYTGGSSRLNPLLWWIWLHFFYSANAFSKGLGSELASMALDTYRWNVNG
jgi:hypothetical protein